MAKKTTLHPIIPFNLIVDTDVGLIRTIEKKYCNEDVFYKGILKSPVKPLIYLLINRSNKNPLSIAMKDKDQKIMDIYYSQFMEEEYQSIVSNSVTTDIFEAAKMFINSGTISPTILCKNDIEENTIRQLDFGQEIQIEKGDYKDIDSKIYDPVYFKNYEDSLQLATQLSSNNLYIANYPFNFDLSDNGEKIIRKDITILLLDHNEATITDVYRIDESFIPLG